MNPDLIGMARSSLTRQLVEQTATAIDQPVDRTRMAMTGGISAVFAALIQRVMEPGGASRLFGALPAFQDVGGPSQPNLLERLFGGNAGALTDVVANHAGMSRAAGASILSTTSTLVLSMLGRQTAMRGLGADGLRDMLLGQRKALASDPNVPAGLASALGLKSLSGLGGVPSVVGAAPKRQRLIGAALLGLGLLALIGFALSRRRAALAPETTITAATIPAPAGALESSIANGSTPGHLPVGAIEFDVAESTPTADSMPAIDALATALKRYPSARVRVDGNADAVGDVGTNRDLSMRRAEVIKAMLVERGVDASQIATGAQGMEAPIGDGRRVLVTLLSR